MELQQNSHACWWAGPSLVYVQRSKFILSDENKPFAMYITKKSGMILKNLLDFFVIYIANVHALLYFFQIFKYLNILMYRLLNVQIFKSPDI